MVTLNKKSYTVEMLLLQECRENKSTRENVMKNALEQYPEICEKIIDIYDLKRVNDKYILKIRDYSENSYSKKKIRYEEIIFLRKSYVYLKLENFLIESIEFKRLANKITSSIYDDNELSQIDEELYDYLFDRFMKINRKTS